MRTHHPSRTSLLLVLLSASSLAQAQPTLGSGALSYTPGDYYTLHQSGAYQTPALGAGLTWNFASLMPGAATYGAVNIVNPAGINGGAYFPTATAADHDPDFTSAFYASSIDEELYLGQFAPFDQVRICTDPQTLVHYPFAYEDAFTDTFECTETGGGFDRIRIGTTTVSYVGYGTVITPFGTYTDCVLIRTQLDWTDEILGVPEIDMGWHVNYRFHAPGIPVYLVSFEQHSYTQGGQTMESNNVFFPNLLSTAVGSPGPTQAGMLIQPNPAVEMITVQRDQEGPCLIELIDASGRVVIEERTSGAQPVISLAGVRDGVYALRMTTGNGSVIRRVVKGG